MTIIRNCIWIDVSPKVKRASFSIPMMWYISYETPITLRWFVKVNLLTTTLLTFLESEVAPLLIPQRVDECCLL